MNTVSTCRLKMQRYSEKYLHHKTRRVRCEVRIQNSTDFGTKTSRLSANFQLSKFYDRILVRCIWSLFRCLYKESKLSYSFYSSTLFKYYLLQWNMSIMYATGRLFGRCVMATGSKHTNTKWRTLRKIHKDIEIPEHITHNTSTTSSAMLRYLWQRREHAVTWPSTRPLANHKPFIATERKPKQAHSLPVLLQQCAVNKATF